MNDARNVAEQREADVDEQITPAASLAENADGLQKVIFEKSWPFTHWQ